MEYLAWVVYQPLRLAVYLATVGDANPVEALGLMIALAGIGLFGCAIILYNQR